jgi:hypothetical protein
MGKRCLPSELKDGRVKRLPGLGLGEERKQYINYWTKAKLKLISSGSPQDSALILLFLSGTIKTQRYKRLALQVCELHKVEKAQDPNQYQAMPQGWT